MSYQLKFWNGPEGEPMNPFASVFDDMPSDEFATHEEAETAANAYCDSYKQRGGGSNAGWNEEDDSYWIRHEVEPDKWRFTRFMIAKALSFEKTD
jgi:hypothetical protein